MEKNLFKIGMLAVAACAFIACQKEAQESVEKKVVTHVATVTLSKEEATKTAVVEGAESASYVWTAGDDAYLHVYENGTEGTITNFALSNGNTVATLTVEFTGDEAASYDYTAKYAKTLSGSKNPKVQETQAPTATSFDPAADILISKATADVTGVTTRATELTFTMGRVVSVNKMTLTGLVEGELVSKVEFTLGTSFLGGYYSGESYGSNVKTLTANYATPIAVGADGKFPVYFTCAPVDAASITSVVVTTDKNVYTKSSSLDPNPFDGKTITFAVGTMKRFNMAMGGYGEAISTGTDYTLVESQSDLFDGATYIIVGNADDLVAMGTQNSNNRASVGVTASSKVINIDNTIAAATFTIEKVSKGYTILDNSTSKYLYTGSTSSNRLQSTDTVNDNATWNISISNGVATITNVGNTSRGVMCLNGNLFNCYASLSSSYKTLSLYVDLDTCIPTLATPSVLAEVQNTNEIYVTWDEVANADGYTVTCTGQSAQNISTGVGEATFTGLTDGTYTVTVTAISNDHTSYLDSQAATVEDLLIGSPKGTVDNPYTVAEALAIIDGYADKDKSASEVYVSGIVANVGSYNNSYHSVTYDISDDGSATTTLNIYSGKFVANTNFTSNEQIKVGDEVIVYGYLYLYGTTQEMYQNNYIYSLNGKTKVLTPGSLSAVADDANLQITVTWGAATGTTSSISYEVTCGTQSYNANTAGNHTFTMADYGEYDVTVVATASDALSAETGTTVTLTNPGAKKDYYKLVTSVSEITAGTYVVGALRSASATNAFYFAKASVSSGDWVVSDGSITVIENEGVRRFETSNLPSGAVEFTLTGDNTDGFTISNGSNYLYYTAASNRKLAFAAAGSSQKWTVSAKSSPLITGGVVLKAKGTQNYTISENSTAVGAIRGYANTTEYRAIYLFKKVNE